MAKQIGLPLALAIENILKAHSIPYSPSLITELVTAFEKQAALEKANNIMAFLDTKLFLDELKRLGMRVGILTSKPRWLVAGALQKLALDTYFDANDILAEGECPAKPAPDGLITLIAKANIDKTEAVYIGDSTSDAKAALAAGVDFIGVTTGPTSAEELQAFKPIAIHKNLREVRDYIYFKTALKAFTVFAEQHKDSPSYPKSNSNSFTP